MAKQNEEYMTAEELRNKLYHSLRDKGLVNNMKSQLRTSLVSELKKSVSGRLTVEDLVVPESGSLIHRASNSLVADHLCACKYDYTHSVFLPECGMDKKRLLTNDDILQLLKISPQSRLFKKMALENNPGRSKKGFLWQLLTELCSMHSEACTSTSTQTDLIKVATVSTLDEKMNVLDELFSSRREENYRTGATALEDRLIKIQRQLEERCRSEMKLEVSRVKDEEVARIRLEEKENFRREIDKARKDLERRYQSKFDALVVRERNATERLQREQEMQEKEIYKQRQSILEEIEAVRMRESSVKRETDVMGRERKLEYDRLKAQENDLRHRTQEIARKEIEFTQRLENEMTTFKVEYQAKFLERTQNIEVREASLRENERRVSEDQKQIDSLKEEVRDKAARINELETFLQEIRHTEVNATKHNDFLNAKLRDMSDYTSVKEQNITYRTEIENLKMRMTEIMQLNEKERIRQEELMRELRRPIAIPDYVEHETRRVSSDHNTYSRRHESPRHSAPMMNTLEAQTLHMKEMAQELMDVKHTLAHTQKALHNEVYRKPQDADTSRLLLNISQRSGAGAAGRSILTSGDESDFDLKIGGRRKGRGKGGSSTRVNRDDIYNDVDLDDLSAPKVSLDFTTTEGDESSNQSADIIADTKYRLKSLEKEAQNLEKAYVDFHYNLTNPASLPDPTRHSLKKSLSDRSGHHMAAPTASPIANARPLSSTPYHEPQATSGADGDVSTDSLTELRGSSSQTKRKSNSPDEVPKFSLSDDSDDEARGARVERPRSITVEDLEAHPGSPNIMVVPADASSDLPTGSGTVSSLQGVNVEATTGYKSREETTVQRETTLPPPAKLPPMSVDTAYKAPALDDAWKSPALDDAWKSDATRQAEADAEAARWVEEQKRKEEERERREQEAWEREQEELRLLEQKTHSTQVKPAPSPPPPEEKSHKSDDGIDPVMKEYMEKIQQQRTAPQTKPPSEKSASQVDEELSLTEEVKSENDDDSGDDFNW